MLGGDGALRSLVRATALLEGWTVCDVQPVVAAAGWNGIDLVVVMGGRVTATMALLDALRHSGYEGSFVLLAPDLTPSLRQRAFLQGALDVIHLPADPQTLSARLWTVLHGRQDSVFPRAADAP